MDAAGGLREVLDRLDGVHARQRQRLEVVGGDEGGQRQDVLLQGIVGVQSGAGLLSLADQHRVQDHVAQVALGQRAGDRIGGGRVAEQAELQVVVDVGGQT